MNAERPWLYVARDYADLGDRDRARATLNKSYENDHFEVCGYSTILNWTLCGLIRGFRS